MQLGRSRVVELEIFGQECRRAGIALKPAELAGLLELCADEPVVDAYLQMNTNTYRRASTLQNKLGEFINYDKAIRLVVPVLSKTQDGRFAIGWTLTKAAKVKLEMLKAGKITLDKSGGRYKT